MTKNIIRQGHSIYVYDDEIPFIERTLEEKNISKNSLDKEQNILNLNTSYVGFIKTNRRFIEIKPKHEHIKLNHILRMYFFVNGTFTNFDDEIFDISSHTFNFDLTSLFLKELEFVIKRGLPTEYISSQENMKYARGKVDYTKTYKNILMEKKEPFVTEVDELSLETSLNRTLKAALEKVKNYVDDKKTLSNLEKHLSNVSDTYTSLDLKNVIINTKNYFCKNVFLYAKLILEESHYDSVGDIGGQSFLINSDLLFEQFIKKILFSLTNDKYFIDWNNKQEYGVYNNITKTYNPDILYKYIVSEKKALGIIDVKNKFSNIYINADVYQMLFYSGMLSSQKIILCYPSAYYRDSEVLEVYSDNFITKNIYAVFINICEESKGSFIESINRFIDDIYAVITK